jgi:hypothetical protein
MTAGPKPLSRLLSVAIPFVKTALAERGVLLPFGVGLFENAVTFSSAPDASGESLRDLCSGLRLSLAEGTGLDASTILSSRISMRVARISPHFQARPMQN